MTTTFERGIITNCGVCGGRDFYVYQTIVKAVHCDDDGDLNSYAERDSTIEEILCNTCGNSYGEGNFREINL